MRTVWGVVIGALCALSIAGSPAAEARASAQPFTATEAVPRGTARQANVQVEMGAGELRVGGGASGLVEARFDYHPAHWRPQVSARSFGERTDVRITQPPLWRWPWTLDMHNVWVVRLNDQVPTELDVRLGAGESHLFLADAALSRLDVRIGAGAVTLDLRGPWQRDLFGYVHGGVGRVTVLLPAQVGVRVDVGEGIGRVRARGLRQEDSTYVNERFGTAPVNLHLKVEAGVGEIVLESGSEAST